MIKKTGKGKVRVGRLNINKETVRDLSSDEMEKVKGGIATEGCTGACKSFGVCTLPPVGITAVGTPGCGGKTSGKKCNP